jgi:hypothetical protein
MFGTAAFLLIGAAVAGLISSRSSNRGSSDKQPVIANVRFIVRGSAPNGLEITYGDDASNYQTRNLPMDVTRSAQDNAVYWVMAQLQGGGRITCKVILGNASSAGHAIGGYNTCTAHSPGDPVVGWN